MMYTRCLKYSAAVTCIDMEKAKSVDYLHTE